MGPLSGRGVGVSSRSRDVLCTWVQPPFRLSGEGTGPWFGPTTSGLQSDFISSWMSRDDLQTFQE